MNLPFRVFVFHHRRQIGSFEVCDLTSVTCDVNFFAKSLPVTVRVDKNVACLSSLLVTRYGNPSVRENLVLVTVTTVHPSMYANVTITWPYRGLKFKESIIVYLSPASLQRTSLILDSHVMVN